MIKKILEQKYSKLLQIMSDSGSKIQAIVEKEFKDFDSVKVQCGPFHIFKNEVEFKKDKKRVVFFLSSIEEKGSYVRKESKNYNTLYEEFSKKEINEIKERLNRLFI